MTSIPGSGWLPAGSRSCQVPKFMILYCKCNYKSKIPNNIMNINIKSLLFEISYLSAKLRGGKVKVLRMGQGQLKPLITHSIWL